MTLHLSALFSKHLGAEPCLSDGELGTRLVAYLDLAHAAFPTIQLEDAAYLAFLAKRCNEQRLPPLLHAADLYLACGCVLGHKRALLHFCRCYEPVVRRVLTRRAAPLAPLADIQQEVFAKLLLPAPGCGPKIADYRGVGALRSWVSAVTVTTLLMSLRSQERRREQPWCDDDVAVAAWETDPEVSFLKRQYRETAAAALVCALGQLSERERAVLRLHLCERLSVDRLGVIYRVNRATAARWLVGARAALLHRTRAELQLRLGVSEKECDGILKLFHGDAEFSVTQVLSASPETSI